MSARFGGLDKRFQQITEGGVVGKHEMVGWPGRDNLTPGRHQVQQANEAPEERVGGEGNGIVSLGPYLAVLSAAGRGQLEMVGTGLRAIIQCQNQHHGSTCAAYTNYIVNKPGTVCKFNR